MRIVHFSDIHAGGWPQSLSGLFDKRAFGALNHLLRRSHLHEWRHVADAVQQIRLLSPDIVVCTGDITTLGEPAEFETALEALRPLIEDHRFELIYVPGNHDAYTAREASQQALADAFSRLNRGKWQLSELPVSLLFQHVRFLLLNEAVPAPAYSSAGIVDAPTRQWLAKELDGKSEDGPAATILVGHYPLLDRHGETVGWRRTCRHNEGLLAALRDGRVNLSLCGHMHTHFARREDGGAAELCAGSLTGSGVFNLVDYNLLEGKIEHRWLAAGNLKDGAAAVDGDLA